MIMFNTTFNSSTANFDTDYNVKTVNFKTDFGSVKVISGADVYEGDYVVTPDFDIHTLQTKDKLLKDDVTVKKIPVWTVENGSGGNTVIIGGEYDYGNI